MFGFLNIYKPKGMTSHDVISALRRLTKIKQIGHTGTLDPFAEGVLPVCIGKATRLIEYLDDEKAYVGTVQLGTSTTTYDIEGEILKTSDKIVTLEEIESTLNSFRGEIEQIPPIYSAIKVNGKKLYEYARKGEEIEIQPRKVNIFKLDILNFNTETKTLELYIKCSKGTYIRSIANDLGEKLGTFGHLIKLVRVQAGKFFVENSINLNNLQSTDNVKSNLIYPLEYIELPKYEINEKEKELISHGMQIKVTSPDGLMILTSKNTLIAVGNVTNNTFKCSKVFI